LSSVKLLIHGVKELKNLFDVTELMAPGDVRRLYNVVRKKAAEWAVLDSDPRVSGGTVVNAMVAPKVEICEFFAAGNCRRGKDCRWSRDVSKTKGRGKGDRKSADKAAGKQRGPKDQRFNCGDMTSPPHRAKDCPKPRRVAAAKADEPAGAGAKAKPREQAPPSKAPLGLKQQDKLHDLAKAYLAKLATGSSTEEVLRRMAFPAVLATSGPHTGNGATIVIADSGAEVHIVGRTDYQRLTNVRVRRVLCQLDTANGRIALSKEGDVTSNGIVLMGFACNPFVAYSLLSLSCLENEGWTYTQGGGQAVLRKGPEEKRLAKSAALYLLGTAGVVLTAIEATSDIVTTANDDVILRVPRTLPQVLQSPCAGVPSQAAVTISRTSGAGAWIRETVVLTRTLLFSAPSQATVPEAFLRNLSDEDMAQREVELRRAAELRPAEMLRRDHGVSMTAGRHVRPEEEGTSPAHEPLTAQPIREEFASERYCCEVCWQNMEDSVDFDHYECSCDRLMTYEHRVRRAQTNYSECLVRMRRACFARRVRERSSGSPKASRNVPA